MKLRYVLLMAAAAGAFASLFLAGNMYAQMKDTERGADAAFSRAELVRFDLVHALGFLALSFLFLALFLLLVAALRDPKFVSRVENEPMPAAPKENAPTITVEMAPPVELPQVIETSPAAPIPPPDPELPAEVPSMPTDPSNPVAPASTETPQQTIKVDIS